MSLAPRLRNTLLALLLGNALLFALGEIAFGAKAKRAGSGLKVGLVFDVGGLGDKSFNDLAYAGLTRAVEELGVDAQYLEPSEGSDREAGLRQFAAQGYDLIIGVGFIFSADIVSIAKEYPETKFACVDFAPQFDDKGNELPTPPNVAGLKFREEEGSFLVGALAGLETKTRAVGFVGGMTIPLIQKFEAGYAAGVRATCPDCRVLVNYAGSDPSAFKDPTKGKEHALAQHARGADIIYHAAGKTGDGVFAAARQRKARAIGVDSDQHHIAPCCIVTSMVKRVDLAILDLVEELAAGRWQGGTRELGLADDFVGIVAEDKNRHLLPIEVRTRVERLREQILAGELEVPDR